jgi:hypothetical protein
LNSINGFEFCYRHFKNHKSSFKETKQKDNPVNNFSQNILSEQDFLYKDFLKKENFSKPNNDITENDTGI